MRLIPTKGENDGRKGKSKKSKGKRDRDAGGVCRLRIRFMSKPVICGCRFARSRCRRRRKWTAAWPRIRRCVFTTRAASGPIRHAKCDVRDGLPALRRDWIVGRGDVEEYEGREILPQDNGYLTKGAEDDRKGERTRHVGRVSRPTSGPDESKKWCVCDANALCT